MMENTVCYILGDPTFSDLANGKIVTMRVQSLDIKFDLVRIKKSAFARAIEAKVLGVVAYQEYNTSVLTLTRQDNCPTRAPQLFDQKGI
jgi:hypothetical protein